MDERKQQDTYDPAALAQAILLDPTRLPAAIGEDLQTLRRMLDDAVAGEDDDAPTPAAPAYGKAAVPLQENKPSDKAGQTEKTDGQLVLRQDEAVQCPVRMIDLSSRREGQYVTVPRVIGGSHG